MTVHIPLRCMGCKHQELTPYQKPCSDCKDCDLYTLIEQEKKPTKADRIRAMSDEELAKVVDWDIMTEMGWKDEPLIDWLQQEVE